MTTNAQLAVESLLETWQQRVANTAELAAVELRLATLSGLAMLLLFVVASAAVVISWGLVVAAAIVLLNGAGFNWWAISLLFAAVHVLIATLSWQLIVRLSRNLSLPALRAAVSEQI